LIKLIYFTEPKLLNGNVYTNNLGTNVKVDNILALRHKTVRAAIVSYVNYVLLTGQKKKSLILFI